MIYESSISISYQNKFRKLFSPVAEQHNGYGGQKPLPQSPRSSNDQRFNGVADQRYPPPVVNGGSGHGDPLLYPGEGMEPPSLQSISSDFSSHNSQKVL
jgi:hypothetical protein